jgi:hypothetical protein
MRGIAISISKKLFLGTDRITEVCLLRHLQQKRFIFISALVLLCLVTSHKAQNRNSVFISDRDVSETIDSFKTADVAKSVEGFRKEMPKPILDAKLRQEILDKLPNYVGSLRLNNDSLLRKVKQLASLVLSLYGRENVYDLIIIQHPTPLLMSDSGVVLVITTGMLSEVDSEDEFLGLVAHEVGHEYFAQYSIYSKFLLQKINERGKETALSRHLGEILGIVELQCDAFASITTAYLGFRPLAFMDCLERVAKKFPRYPIDFHPLEDIRRKSASCVIIKSPSTLHDTESTLLREIKAEVESIKKMSSLF